MTDRIKPSHRKIMVQAVLFGFVFVLNLLLMRQGFGRQYEADFVQNTWLGGRLILDGQNPYDPTNWQTVKDTYLPRSDIFPHYIYPIWVAILATPFGFLSPFHALALWTTINIFLVYACLRLVYALTPNLLSKMDTIVLMILSLLFVPTLHLLLEGQYNMVLFFVILFSILKMQTKTSWLSGILLSLTMGKPQTSWLLVGAIFLWCITRKRWRELAGFLTASLVLWFGPLFIYPDWCVEWLTITREQSVRLVNITPSLWGVMRNWLPDDNFLSSTLTLSILLASAFWWFRKTKLPDTKLWEIAPLAMIGLITSFYGLLYEQVFLLFPFWLCWQWANSRLWRWVLVGWIFLLPIGLLSLLALNPPFNLVYAILQPVLLLPIYFFLKPQVSQSPEFTV